MYIYTVHKYVYIYICVCVCAYHMHKKNHIIYHIYIYIYTYIYIYIYIFLLVRFPSLTSLLVLHPPDGSRVFFLAPARSCRALAFRMSKGSTVHRWAKTLNPFSIMSNEVWRSVFFLWLCGSAMSWSLRTPKSYIKWNPMVPKHVSDGQETQSCRRAQALKSTWTFGLSDHETLQHAKMNWTNKQT